MTPSDMAPTPPTSAPIVVVHTANRTVWKAHWPTIADAPRLSLAACAAPLGTRSRTSPVWLGGGEPTLRADLPQLLDVCSSLTDELGLVTDGLALVSEEPLALLQRSGLARLRIHFHSGQSDVHDWIVNQRGAGRRARRAIQAAVAAGIPTEANILVTRPGAPWLTQTVRLLHNLGVCAIHLRRPLRRSVHDRDFIAVSPRLGLVEEHLDRATVLAAELGLPIHLHGFPRCAAPRTPDAAFETARDHLLWPTELTVLPEVLALGEGPPADACPACPGLPVCGGAPDDYVDRFGNIELQSERPGPPRRPVPHAPVFGQTPPEPPPRGGRAPATRPKVAGKLASWPDLGGDPLAGQPGAVPQSAAVLWLQGPTRALRTALVRHAQDGPQQMILVDRDGHPEAAEMLRESLRLSFAAIDYVGCPGALADLGSRQLGRLKGIARMVLTVDRIDDIPALAERLDTIATRVGCAVEARAWVPEAPSPEVVAAWTAAWTAHLPDKPRFFVVQAPSPGPAGVPARAAQENVPLGDISPLPGHPAPSTAQKR